MEQKWWEGGVEWEGTAEEREVDARRKQQFLKRNDLRYSFYILY